MSHVDALSRHPIMIVQRSELLHKIKATQPEDEQLNSIIKILQDGHRFEDYYLERDILYKDDGLLVLPKQMQIQVIRKAHEDNGHFSVKKTEEIIKRDYWINEVKRKIESVVRNCIPCILAERKRGKPEGFLHPLDKGSVPLDTYHLDHLGPLGATNKGYRYILTVVDGFTKFIWIYPTKSTTSKEVIQKLDAQKKIFGNPRRIITDRGTAFTSEEFKTYCEEDEIELAHITTGIPRGNGQAERFNRTIIPALCKLSLDDENSWYKYVNQLQIILNSSHQRSIKYTLRSIYHPIKIILT